MPGSSSDAHVCADMVHPSSRLRMVTEHECPKSWRTKTWVLTGFGVLVIAHALTSYARHRILINSLAEPDDDWSLGYAQHYPEFILESQSGIARWTNPFDA